MNYAIIDKNTLEIKNVYWSETGIDTNRADYTADVQHIEIPINLDYWCIKSTSNFTIVVDDEKLINKNKQNIDNIRQQRNDLLYKSDWTQIPGNSLTDEKRILWATYRQQLRDLIISGTCPDDFQWPTPPI